MNASYDTFSTPLGDFSVAVDESEAVIGTAFGGVAELSERLGFAPTDRNPARLAKARREIDEYFAGQRTHFSLKTAPRGTAFQKSVWTELRKIPHGKTRTYGELAGQLGRPAAARAVGRANATNPVCLIIPCHRVIGSDGSLTGFAFGEDIKQKLLEHEGALIGSASREN